MSEIALRRRVAEAANRVVKARGADVEGLGLACAALGDLLGAWTGQEVRILIHAESQGEGIDMSKKATDDAELLRHALDALVYHREQTRPIGRNDSVIERLPAGWDAALRGEAAPREPLRPNVRAKPTKEAARP